MPQVWSLFCWSCWWPQRRRTGYISALSSFVKQILLYCYFACTPNWSLQHPTHKEHLHLLQPRPFIELAIVGDAAVRRHVSTVWFKSERKVHALGGRQINCCWLSTMLSFWFTRLQGFSKLPTRLLSIRETPTRSTNTKCAHTNMWRALTKIQWGKDREAEGIGVISLLHNE